MKNNRSITLHRSWPPITESYEILDAGEISYTRKSFLGFSKKIIPLLSIDPYFEEKKSIAIAEVIWSILLALSMTTLALTELVTGENRILNLAILVILLPFLITFINAAIYRSQHSYIFKIHYRDPNSLSLLANQPSPEESLHFAQTLANAIKMCRTEDGGQ